MCYNSITYKETNKKTAMTNRNQKSIEFQALNRKIVQGQFSGGDITSDAGVFVA